MFSDKMKNEITKLGDKLHDYTNDTTYYVFYIIFSIVRAAIWAIKCAWEDAE